MFLECFNVTCVFSHPKYSVKYFIFGNIKCSLETKTFKNMTISKSL
jgi:ribosomal protein S27E